MKTIILLHGALGSKEQLLPLGKVLSNYDVHYLNFFGHGGEPGPDPFSLEQFAGQVLQYIEHNKLVKPVIFGYSMGGYVAMLLAKNEPAKINKVITLGTKFSWDEATAENEIKMLDPEKIQTKLPDFAEQLKKRHAPADWEDVLHKTRDMMTQLGAHNPLQLSDYNDIENPVLLLVGDRDKMISFDETIAVYKNLKNAELCILPATPHPIEQLDITMVGFLVNHFLQK